LADIFYPRNFSDFEEKRSFSIPTGDVTILRLLFAFLKVGERNRDFTTIEERSIGGYPGRALGRAANSSGNLGDHHNVPTQKKTKANGVREVSMKVNTSALSQIPDSSRADGWINATIAVGAGMFVFGLAISAAFAPEWRVLHVFQALIYVAVVAMTRRMIAEGFGAGLSVALFWNALSVFATSAARDGIRELVTLARTGHTQHADVLLSLFAFCGHVLIIVGCIVGFIRIRPIARQVEVSRAVRFSTLLKHPDNASQNPSWRLFVPR
jgi:hypothetical protein